MITRITRVKIWPLVIYAAIIWVAGVSRVSLGVPLFLFSLYAYYRARRLYLKNFRLVNLALLFLLNFTGAFFLVRNHGPIIALPFSAIPMLAALLFNSLEVSLLLTLAGAVSIFSLANFSLGVIFLVSGISSSILIFGARKRSTVIRAGLAVGVIQALTLMLLEGFWPTAMLKYLYLILNGLASSVVVLGILAVFEYFFQTNTNISLLELADFQHPLLQRMVLEAPGTYHHSLVVGNISESACDAVGANALLARVGAYYHDIGKLSKPEYFSENQLLKSNKHDTLSPAMSKLIIMNHVREGLELARKYRLKPAIVDFIRQHHGNSLVYYFYRRALEGLEDDHEVKEEGFRYPGPKPRTKEAAIVLLADSVEAATRALKDPEPAKIEELVHKVVNNKFIDGQLDECDLTLNDLEKISATFVRILSGIYHSRVNYPEEISSGNSHKKLSGQDPHQPEKA
ncbi:MAG: HDIG domain-containing protein [Candidatus Omnitrophota bacterium]|nr:HDIG domain-containing protein [Candidatus Omnitrophota bacterium]